MDFSISEYAWIRTAAHWYGERYDTSAVRHMLREHDPAITQQRSSEIAKAARESLRVAREFRLSSVSSELGDLCPQCDRPSELVSVSLAYTYRKADGSVRTNTIKVLTRWHATIQDVLQEGDVMLDAITGQYGTVVVTDVSVVGGILTPADEQL